MRNKRSTLIAFIAAMCLVSSMAFGQEWHGQAQSGQVHVRTDPWSAFFVGQGEGTFTFVSAEMSFDGKVVKGAPFSATVTSEHVQVMADGNRILSTNTGAIYRDGEGRTRREQQISSLGGYAAENAPAQMTIINDPVAGTNIVLNTNEKTAVKHQVRSFAFQMRRPAGEPAGASTRAAPETGDNVVRSRVGPEPEAFGGRLKMESKMESKTESLGTQEIEGVLAEGTRTTRTIPAGAIGNEQPINIVAERWYSSELQTVVLSTHKDPRFGESTFRLTNITRGEPNAALFQVPADFTINEGGGPGRGRIMRTPRRPNEQ